MMEILFLLGLGFVAGVLGGLLGIGGSVIMIPALSIILGWPFHLAQAVAMTVNPAVAISAAVKHHRNRSISWDAVWKVLPLSIIFIIIAAWGSNFIEGAWLELSFGLFLVWVLWDQIHCLIGKSSHNAQKSGVSIIRYGITGGTTGSFSGLLGIGGGLIRVPLLNTFCRLPMKQAIGTSTAVMFVTAIIGASVKDLSLHNAINESGNQIGLQASDALIRSVWILPGAIIGGWFGAKLTGVLPVKAIRFVFALLVVLACYKLLSGATTVLV